MEQVKEIGSGNNGTEAVMPHEFSGVTSNHVFDISRLQRRKPDLTKLVKPRFLFDGWEIRDASNRKVTEEEFNAGKRGVRVVLPRDENFTLTITYSAVEDPRWNPGSGYGVGWNVTGRALATHYPQTISKNPKIKFEDLVKIAESFLMRAADRQNYDVIRCPDPEFRDFGVFARHIGACLMNWRKVGNELG